MQSVRPPPPPPVTATPCATQQSAGGVGAASRSLVALCFAVPACLAGRFSPTATHTLQNNALVVTV